ncbi:MAG TPA: T9SS type A sorting domain-containing protein [Bacteroidales bacterium]|nr:T9SS type A sorting domain-containing protein [Bacteroidales bacterium]HSA42748.1 T9SS type A sorting domain-containing protein [Bacteroidales bacterium]
MTINDSYAQTGTYHPFPEDNAAWSVSYGGWEPDYCYDRYYHMAGDTVINAMSYHQIHYYGWVGFPSFLTHMCDNWIYDSEPAYFCAIRQDTGLKQVYFIPWGDTTEALLYDFSLNVGDTLNTFNCPYSIGARVVSIDSMMIGNGYRKSFQVEMLSMQTKLIEGIGSITGLVEGLFVFESGGHLDCFSQNGQQLYPFTGGNCELVMNFNHTTETKDKLKISPNPVITEFLIETPNQFQNATFQLFTLPGVSVQEVSLLGSQTLIKRNGLPGGIYFYRIPDKGNLISTGKLIFR